MMVINFLIYSFLNYLHFFILISLYNLIRNSYIIFFLQNFNLNNIIDFISFINFISFTNY